MTDIIINIGLYVTYILIFVAIGIMLFFSIKQFVGNIAKSKTTLYALIGLVVVFGISYLGSSSTDVSMSLLEKNDTSMAASKWIGSGLIMFYVLFAITVISLIAIEAVRPFKK